MKSVNKIKRVIYGRGTMKTASSRDPHCKNDNDLLSVEFLYILQLFGVAFVLNFLGTLQWS